MCLSHIVFESPVRSGFLDPRRGNREPDRSIHFSNLGQPATKLTTTGPHQFSCLQKTGCNWSFAQSFLISRKPASQVTMTHGFLSCDDITCESGHHDSRISHFCNNFISFQQIITEMRNLIRETRESGRHDWRVPFPR